MKLELFYDVELGSFAIDAEDLSGVRKLMKLIDRLLTLSDDQPVD